MSPIDATDSRRETRPRLSFANAYLAGQVFIVIGFVLLWIVGGVEDIGGDDLLTTFGLVAVLGTLPASITGLAAGFVTTTNPRLRFVLIVGLAAAAAAGAFAISNWYTVSCPAVAPAEFECPTSPHDPLGAFVGAEFVVLLQAFLVSMGAGIREKYPPQKRAD